jgi:low affinity Fe/Cu permease
LLNQPLNQPARIPFGCGSLKAEAIAANLEFTMMSKKFAQLAVAEASGNPGVFAVAAMTVLMWLVTGPLFAYSDTWQLVMNAWTNVVTFLMVFVIQNSQNRDSAALQAKLDEVDPGE